MLDKSFAALSKVRLQTACEDYKTACDNFKQGHYKAANNRAYYCIFHSIRAVLALEGKDFKSHGQLIGYFNKTYINAGYFDREHIKTIKKASDMRHDSDYEDFYIATREETEPLISNAGVFYSAVESYVAERLKEDYVPGQEWDDEEELEP